MKHTPSWTTVILLCLLLVAGAAVLVLTPRTVPFDECSPLYRQYAGHEDIEATFIKDYPVDDTTLVDVTLIQATTDSAWERVCPSFIPSIYTEGEKDTIIHSYSVTHWPATEDSPQTIVNPTTTNQFIFITITPPLKTICIFHIETIAELNAIIEYKIHELSSLKK